MNEWVALEQYHHPGTLAEAVALRQEPGTEYISGGSRLVANRPVGVTSLISINQLVQGKITFDDGIVRLPAGVTIQALIDGLRGTETEPLANAAQASCSSRNLRNQRTIGGEILDGSFDSDLRVALAALNPALHIVEDQNEHIHYSDYVGHGIIRSLSIPVAQARTLQTERFSLLPVSPAFLVVASCDVDSGKRIAIGGAMDQIVCGTPESGYEGFVETVAEAFRDDHYGSPEYKQHLLRVALKRLEVMQ